MLKSLNSLIGYAIEAEDGEIGKCHDFLLDEVFWVVRYMVADTGKWLPGRKVLVSPIALGKPDWASKHLPVKVTKAKVENCPTLAEQEPVSRQYERKWFSHYGWATYWAGGGIWGSAAYPFALYDKKDAEEEAQEDTETHKSILRSVKEVIGYHIKATDGSIGHVEDFIVDDSDWVLRYMVVDTKTWLPGKKVLVVPTWISSVSWAEREVGVGLTMDSVKNSPEYDPSAPVNREYEVRFYDYYGRPKYWEEEM